MSADKEHISIKEAFITKLYENVIELAEFTRERLNKYNIEELRTLENPTFQTIRDICLEVKKEIEASGDQRRRFENAEEVAGVVDHIILAIADDDNKLLIDCSYHLDQFLQMHKPTI